MLTNELRLRAEQQIKNATAQYKQGKAAGYGMVSMCLPSFESQEDHDRYHPDDGGSDFREYNEFAAEVLKGLRANGVPAELITIHYDAYAKWLNGQKNTTEMRAAYGAYLAADADTKRKQN